MRKVREVRDALVGLGVIAGFVAAGISGCTSSDAKAWSPAPGDVERIVERCENAVDGLGYRLASGNESAAYQAAGIVETQCGEAHDALSRPGQVSSLVEACQVATEAGGMVGRVAGQAIDDPKPSNVARLETIRGSFDLEKGKCRALMAG